jgi:predicted metal-dependent RNase
MSGDWNTKYGTRRVRHDPPTLEEAIFAAVGITDNVEAQAEIASALMGLSYDDVLVEVKKNARVSARTGTATRVIAGEQGAQRSVVVERRVVRRFATDKRTGT